MRLLRHPRNVANRPVDIERQPRLSRREAGILAPVPRHRRADRIAAQGEPGLAQPARILNLGRRDRDIAQAQLVSIVEGGRAAERQQQHRCDAGLGLPTLG